MAANTPLDDALDMPMSSLTLGLEMFQLASETHSVMTMRLLGMSGLWNVKHTENTRMFAEKPAAFARSAEEALKAAFDGKRPDQVITAAVRPLRSKTRANVARLTARGPGLPR